MKTIRQAHLYLGCLFAPLIIYFCLSGIWQLFRFNDVPKEGPVSSVRVMLHEISKPHTNATLPGKNPKQEKSDVFNLFAAIMGLGMTLSSILGIVLALKYTKKTSLVIFVLLAGTFLPIAFLFLT